MESLGAITPFSIIAIGLTGIIAWVQWIAKKDMVRVQSRFEIEQAERRKLLDQFQNERLQLTSQHDLYNKLIETINRTSASADLRDTAHNATIKILSTALDSIGVETRVGNTKHLDALHVIREAVILQTAGLKTVVESSTTVNESMTKLLTLSNTVKMGISELDERFSRIESSLSDIKTASSLDDMRILNIMNDVSYIKTAIEKTINIKGID